MVRGPIARRLAVGLLGCLASGLALGWGMPPFAPYGAPPPNAQQPAQQQPGQQPAYPPQGYVPQGYPQPGYPQGGYPQGPYGPPVQGGWPGMPQGQHPGQPPGQPQFNPFQYRPVAPDNARGAPPAYPAPPAQQPYQAPSQARGQSAWPGSYAQQQPARSRSAPRLEWTLDQTRPYLQQNLVLRLRLISAETLTTADPELASSGDALMTKVAGPESSTRNAGDGRREVVTEFVLSLTPLRTGELTLPAPKITGTRPGNYGRSEPYEAEADQPIRLQVRPAVASVRPWLPLRSLTLEAHVDHPEEVRPGQPVSLALELSAEGGDAAQLPNLEEQLVGPDFRVYREQTTTDNGLSGDGRSLVAKRTEYYTLVPQTGGNVRLPEITVPWWNIDTESRQVARLPIRTVAISGGRGPFMLPESLTSGEGWGRIWLPFAALLLVLAGYWAGVLYRRPGAQAEPGSTGTARAVERVRGGLTAGARALGEGARGILRGLHPAPLAAWARERTLGLLPGSSRLLMALRQANQATTPAEWCQRFEQAARVHLRTNDETGSPRMTERMLRLRPRADRAKVTRLMEQLDAALYGRQDIDFPRWKRELAAQLGRGQGLLRGRRAEPRIRRAALPELNPRAA